MRYRCRSCVVNISMREYYASCFYIFIFLVLLYWVAHLARDWILVLLQVLRKQPKIFVKYVVHYCFIDIYIRFSFKLWISMTFSFKYISSLIGINVLYYITILNFLSWVLNFKPTFYSWNEWYIITIYCFRHISLTFFQNRKC